MSELDDRLRAGAGTRDCPGSWRPIEVAMGAEVLCPVCARRVYTGGPPLAFTTDPFPGAPAPRIRPHWAPRSS
ncbi:MAG: hypothetical protein U0229_22870 [Anaeromyxobacter sp.]